MQTNPISAQSFKGSYQLPEFDTDRAIELARALRNMEDEFKHQKEEPEKKNKLELALTAAVGLSGMFLIGKKGYKKANKILSDFLSNEKVKDVAKFASEKASVIISKAKESDAMAKVIKGASSIGNKISNAAKAIDEKALQKIGKANIAGAATAVAGGAYISNVDSDKNGVADILEKGVNAYKGALSQIGAIGAVVDLVS